MLIAGVRRQEAEGRAGLEREPSQGMGGCHDESSARPEKGGGARDETVRLCDMFEDGEEQHDIEGPLSGKADRRVAFREIPFEENSRGKAGTLHEQDLRAPVAPHVRRQP